MKTLAAIVLVALSAAAPALASDGEAARAGVALAERRGAITAAEARYFRQTVTGAERTALRLPEGRARELRAVLADVAAGWRTYDRARARTVFGMLAVNTRELGRGELPPARTDVLGPQGLIYRSFPGDGLQFHPLMSFQRLQGAIDSGHRARAWRIAAALLARGHRRGDGLVWEYHFGFAGGRPPWTSGMAQALAADALARLGLRAAARRAYRAIPDGLLLSTPSGPWIRLYRFSGMAVLNAQLQTVVSLERYARLAKDPAAARLAARLAASTRELLPRFDTGCWTRYALDGRPAPLEYHRYVVQLLWQLARRTGDRTWGRWALRFDADQQAPTLYARSPRTALYPFPRDGFRDAGDIGVWVSKCATVTVTVGGRHETAWLARGFHRFDWKPGGDPGRYPVRVSARDAAGKTATAAPRRVVVRRDRTPPAVRARVSATHVTWRARDLETPWVAVGVELRRGGGGHVVQLGRGFRGQSRLRLPDARWNVTLVVRDSSGNATRVPLGGVGAWPNVAR